MSYFDKFIETIKNNGWIIEEANEKIELPEVYRGRIGEFEDIVKKYKDITNPDNTIWFVIGDYLKCDDMIGLKYRILAGSKDDMGTGLTAEKIIENGGGMPYVWDAFKNISIGASEDNEHTKRIIKWWDNHFPFIMSCTYGYDEFYAINLDDGSIEYGSEPMFEETEKIADSLEDFFKMSLSGDIEV